jgi:hypothetical protein
MDRKERARLEAHAELWDLLGRDTLGTRITGMLVRKGEALTVEELRSLTELGREYVQDIPGIGPDSVDRIWERLGLREA